MPKIPPEYDTCSKCHIRFRWLHSLKGWCWWCEGSPKAIDATQGKPKTQPKKKS